MNFLTNDGIHLHYTDNRKNSDKVVVFIPGIGGSSKLFQIASGLFTHVGFRVLTFDPRNQGHSQRTRSGQRISRHAVDLQELLTNLNLKKVIAIGNSMGASNLWAYLSLYGASRLVAMIDLDQSPKMFADEGWPFGFKDLTWQNFYQVLKKPFGRSTYKKIDENLFQTAKRDAAKDPYDPRQNFKCLLDHACQDWRDVVAESPVPLLVLAGQNSPYFNPQFTTAIKRA